jgi:glycerol-3-phosphate acyltransferase PlsX
VRRAGDAAQTHFTDEIAQAVAPSTTLLAAVVDGATADPTPNPARRPAPTDA